MLVSITLIIALLFDALFGEPRRWHPLVGFGKLANRIEQKLNKQNKVPQMWLRLSGLFAWIIVVLPFVAMIIFIENLGMAYALEFESEFKVILGVIFLSFAIGAKSLTQHARAVENALNKKDIELARQRIAMIVSRDTSMSDEVAINTATIESVLENGSDAIFAAIFWFIVLGAPGVVLYRLANTLDAMWGYRTERYQYFGWAAARIDDVLNWIPARLTAISYSLAGHTGSALKCWLTQAKNWHGINPGVVMASGAGALQVKLGGTAIYHNKEVDRPELGTGMLPEIKDISRAIKIIQYSIVIWLLFIFVIDYLSHFI